MSDLLIKNCKMPTFCVDCPCLDVENMACFPKKRHITPPEMLKLCRPDWCPLVEVPTHGRLIDANVLYEKTAEWEAKALHIMGMYDGNAEEEWRRWATVLNERTAFKYDVADAPTVIEASEDGEQDG